MESIFPTSFWPLALAHGLALLCPGPDFILIVSHAVRHRLRGSIFICFGIACGNALYVALAIAGWMGLQASDLIQRPLEIAGAVYLGWLGTRIFRSAKAAATVIDGAATRATMPAQFGLGLASALLNPKNMIFYLTIMTVLIESESLLRQRVAAGVWMCMAVLLWDLFVAATISHPAAQKALWKRIPLIEKTCGAFLVVAAAYIMISPWFK